MRPEVYISEEEIQERVETLGLQITEEFKGQDLVVLCVLNGAFMFCSDLIKEISLPIKLDFISLSSYGAETKSSGQVIVKLDTELDLSDRNVLIVEDIIDTGLTMKTLVKMIQERKAKSVKIASLLFKPARNLHPIPIDYLGFEIEDKFVVGYGLDYAGRYRELPYVGILNADN